MPSTLARSSKRVMVELTGGHKVWHYTIEAERLRVTDHHSRMPYVSLLIPTYRTSADHRDVLHKNHCRAGMSKDQPNHPVRDRGKGSGSTLPPWPPNGLAFTSGALLCTNPTHGDILLRQVPDLVGPMVDTVTGALPEANDAEVANKVHHRHVASVDERYGPPYQLSGGSISGRFSIHGALRDDFDEPICTREGLVENGPGRLQKRTPN